jgi:glycyl-tRNA synthetase
MPESTPTLDTIVALAKRRGFVFPTSAIYGGLANSYDYGPVGVQLLKNIKDLWWKEFITGRTDMVGLDSQILLHPRTWEASGHVTAFNDPLVEDVKTNKRYRADHLIKNWVAAQLTAKPDDKAWQNFSVENLKLEEMGEFITEHKILSPEGNPLSKPKAFNLLFETAIGTVAGEKSKVYLRGETAQGIFSNFKQVTDSSRVKLPFGVGQIGKSFRNEITTGQFVFRTLEFEQAEIEYFIDPEQQDWKTVMEDWKKAMWSFVTDTLGIKAENLRWRQHTDKERSHYSKDTFDLDFNFPFGWSELWGIAYRTDYDLKQHMQFSGESLEYVDSATGRKFIPHVIEPAVGVNRLFLMVLTNAYRYDAEKQRVVLELAPRLAPYQVAVFPLVKNKPELTAKAEAVFQSLRKEWRCTWDERGNIGKRYLSQDEIGTPFCITVDYQTLEDNTVTLRDRSTAEQTRVELAKLESHLATVLR